jgi:hypothetical protein
VKNLGLVTQRRNAQTVRSTADEVFRSVMAVLPQR